VNFLPLLEAKRDGKTLTASQLQQIVSAYTAGEIPDYQMAAFLMAVYFRGLDPAETRTLTLAMRDSGESLSFPQDLRPVVDKHSTGGVGDKVSLPLAPLLACLGFRVPMISGRGLGITGGTLDKLDSIPGFQTKLPARRIVEIVQSVGCVICGQTERMAPADKRLYVLRDVTGTVPSIPLIVASILSKKLAEGLQALVLDVKFGAAAFMPGLKEARELAQAMVTLGNASGVKTRALLTSMDAPLGHAAGNWLEVKEATAFLSTAISTASPPNEPNEFPDLRELVVACAAQLLINTGKSVSIEAARKQAEECLVSGRPRAKWDEMLVAQGADLEAFERRLALDHTAAVLAELKAVREGFVSRCDARVLGEVIRDLGGGRLMKDSTVNPEVGLDRIVKPGEKVARGGTLVRVHAATLAQAENALARLASAFAISTAPSPRAQLIAEVVS
jgi:pyrimidine-nucleoside phosphorylase